ncbi:hypothetical protein LINPERPRIM_LOCUS36324 [Linum perenne]
MKEVYVPEENVKDITGDNSQQKTVVEKGSTSGNDTKSFLKEKVSPGMAVPDQPAGGGASNDLETPEGVDGSPGQEGIPKAVIVEEDALSPSDDGKTSDEEEGDLEDAVMSNQLKRFIELGDVGGLNVVSPVKGRVLTRQQQQRRRK